MGRAQLSKKRVLKSIWSDPHSRKIGKTNKFGRTHALQRTCQLPRRSWRTQSEADTRQFGSFQHHAVTCCAGTVRFLGLCKGECGPQF